MSFFSKNKEKSAANPGADAPKVNPHMRIYAIGDIHGRHDLLISMLETILDDAETLENDRECEIVLLGDYIDRGDNSRAVLETLSKLQQRSATGVKFLKGNHEAALLEFIDTPLKGAAWLGYGAQQTLASYGIVLPRHDLADGELIQLRDHLVEAMGEHLEFVRHLASNYRSGNVIFTHAGLDPADAETLADDGPMLWGHPSSFDDAPIAGKLIVHGHYDAPDPIQRPGRICVDTGAYYTGRLTAARLDDQVHFLSVKA
jgi:serine/threonine protein phosphatase 1